MTWMCWFFHKWSKWEDMPIAVRYSEGELCKTDGQGRYCLRCNIKELRMVK